MPEQSWPALYLKSCKEIRAVAKAITNRIYKFQKRYLYIGSYSPASNILSQLAFGQKLNRMQSSEANIY